MKQNSKNRGNAQWSVHRFGNEKIETFSHSTFLEFIREWKKKSWIWFIPEFYRNINRNDERNPFFKVLNKSETHMLILGFILLRFTIEFSVTQIKKLSQLSIATGRLDHHFFSTEKYYLVTGQVTMDIRINERNTNLSFAPEIRL